MYAIRSYYDVNNGVYRAGFATSQGAYEEAFRNLFDTLDEIEQILAKKRYLTGATITEADWRLFCTLVITSYSIHYTKLYDLGGDQVRR